MKPDEKTKAFREKVENKYTIKLHSWTSLISSVTMSSIIRQRINDGILVHESCPLLFKEAGVDAPDHTLLNRLMTDTSYSIVKESYLRRLRVCAFSDHYNVFAIFSTK